MRRRGSTRRCQARHNLSDGRYGLSEPGRPAAGLACSPHDTGLREARTEAPARVRAALISPSCSPNGRHHDTYLAAQYHRLRGRRGHAKATKAVGHSILVAAYHILDRGVPYHDLGGDWFNKRRPDAQIRKLIHQLNGLGYQVTLNPLQAA